MTFPEGKRLVDEMKVNFDISRDFTKQSKVPRGDDNWYKHCGIVIKKMAKEYPESKEYLISYLVAHMLELLLFDDKLEVMNYLYSLENIKKVLNLINTKTMIKSYISGLLIDTTNINNENVMYSETQHSIYTSIINKLLI